MPQQGHTWACAKYEQAIHRKINTWKICWSEISGLTHPYRNENEDAEAGGTGTKETVFNRYGVPVCRSLGIYFVIMWTVTLNTSVMDILEVISCMQANNKTLNSRRDISSEAGRRVKLMMKRVSFQTLEPKTDGDASVRLGGRGKWESLSYPREIITTEEANLGLLSHLCWPFPLKGPMYSYSPWTWIIRLISWRNTEFYVWGPSDMKFSLQITRFALVLQYL